MTGNFWWSLVFPVRENRPCPAACINRLIDPTEGKIVLDGVDITAAKELNFVISAGISA
jgi:hypothetical protein